VRGYVPLDVDIFGNRRMLKISPLARLVFITCLVIAKRNESDGRVTLPQIAREQPDIDDPQSFVKGLVAQGLLGEEEDDDDEAFIIPGWLERNKSRAEIDELRAKRAAAGARGGRPPGEIKTKQVAKTRESNLLERDEASGKPNTTQHNTTEGKNNPSDLEADFVALYARWPIKRKGDEAKARAAYRALRGQSVDREALERAANAYMAENQGKDPTYLKGMATFFAGVAGPWCEYFKAELARKPSCTECGISGTQACPYPQSRACARGDHETV